MSQQYMNIHIDFNSTAESIKKNELAFSFPNLESKNNTKKIKKKNTLNLTKCLENQFQVTTFIHPGKCSNCPILAIIWT